MAPTGFAKLFASCYQRSLVGAGLHVYAVWPYILAHASPPDGIVPLHPSIVAATLGCDTQDVEMAIEYLSAPDVGSQNKEFDGRRIVPAEGLGPYMWRVVSFAKYRAARDLDERREQNRAAQRRFRQKLGKPRARPEPEPDSGITEDDIPY